MNFSILKKNKLTLLILAGFLCILSTSVFITLSNNEKPIENVKPKIEQPREDVKAEIKEEVKVKPKVVKASPEYKVETSVSETTITGAELDKHLKGELKGLGNVFVDAGNKHDLDPIFLAALAAQETGWGDADLAGHPWNNIGGITCMPDNYERVFGADYPNPGCATLVTNGTSWQKFNSLEDSIKFKAAYLKENYVESGKETIKEIQTVYAPDNASNDKTGLNNHWVKNIVSIMNDVKEAQTI